MGAWIETPSVSCCLESTFSRTPRGCVDWNLHLLANCLGYLRRTPRGCVDWNYDGSKAIDATSGRTPRGCVDWNFDRLRRHGQPRGRTPRGCVDWNLPAPTSWCEWPTSHSSWVRGLKLLRFQIGISNILSPPPRGGISITFNYKELLELRLAILSLLSRIKNTRNLPNTHHPSPFALKCR